MELPVKLQGVTIYKSKLDKLYDTIGIVKSRELEYKIMPCKTLSGEIEFYVVGKIKYDIVDAERYKKMFETQENLLNMLVSEVNGSRFYLFTDLHHEGFKAWNIKKPDNKRLDNRETQKVA